MDIEKSISMNHIDKYIKRLLWKPSYVLKRDIYFVFRKEN